MSHHPKEDASLGGLLKNLVDDTRTLIQEEVALAKAEIREGLAVVGRGTAYMAVAAGLGLAALLCGLYAANLALAAGLIALGVPDLVAVWLAPLILMVIFGAVAFALFKRGQEVLQEAQLVPRQTIQSVGETKDWVGRKVS